MQFSIVSTMDDFSALEDRWNDLISRAPGSSVFQTFAWLNTWWRVFGDDRAMHIITASDGKTLIGLLPVYIERSHLLSAIGLRKLRLIGYGGDTTPDDLGPILAESHQEQAIDLLTKGLNSLRSEWDIAEFDDLDPQSPLISAIQAQRPGELEVAEGAKIAYVELPDSFDGYLAKLSSNRRSKIRRGRKKLGEHADYRFHIVRSQAELDRHYPDLIRLHKDRWEGRAEDIGFSTEGYVTFHRDVMADLLKQDALRLMFLISEERAIAASYCYRWRRAFYFFQGGIDKDYKAYRIGEVMMGHAIEQAISEGMQLFDMLRGEHDYKNSLTDMTRRRTHLRLNQPTLRTISYRTLRAGYRSIRGLYASPSDHDHGAADGVIARTKDHAA